MVRRPRHSPSAFTPAARPPLALRSTKMEFRLWLRRLLGRFQPGPADFLEVAFAVPLRKPGERVGFKFAMTNFGPGFCRFSTIQFRVKFPQTRSANEQK